MKRERGVEEEGERKENMGGNRTSDDSRKRHRIRRGAYQRRPFSHMIVLSNGGARG